MSNVPNNVVIVEDVPNQVIINQDAPNQVVVRSGGSSSGNTRRYVHTQQSAATTWTINHSLGGRPSVTIVDTAGTVVIGEVKYNSDSQVVLEFTSAFSGFAYLT
jgi:hypothetical protein